MNFYNQSKFVVVVIDLSKRQYLLYLQNIAEHISSFFQRNKHSVLFIGNKRDKAVIQTSEIRKNLEKIKLYHNYMQSLLLKKMKNIFWRIVDTYLAGQIIAERKKKNFEEEKEKFEQFFKKSLIILGLITIGGIVLAQKKSE